jgi:DNA invertase Pin-like site-specific DNA recombinase
MSRKPTVQDRKNVAYCRVSTEDQVREGVSLAAQEERLRAFALATGRENLVVIKDEGVSAKSLERPGLARLLEAVRAGEVASVTVLKLDRLTRSVRDLADLLEIFAKAEVALVSVTESLDTSTASGRLMLNLLASVSQWEREAIGERTSFALAHKRRNRAVYAHAAFGWRANDGSLVPVPEEQEALAEARLMKTQGASLRDIGALFTSKGLQPPQGGKAWYAASVKVVLGSKLACEGAA